MSTAPGASAPLPPEITHADVVPDPVPEPEFIAPTTPRRAAAALTALSIAGFIFVTNEIAIFGLLKLMAEDLGRTESEIGLVVTGFAFVSVVASVPFAIALRRVQRRVVVGGSLAVLALGALVVALTSSVEMLLVGRVISALGQAAFWAVANPIAGALFPPQVRGKMTARMLIGTSAAGVVGLPAVTRLGQQTDWHTPFLVIGGFALVLAVLTWVLIPSYRPDASSRFRAPNPSRQRFVAILAVVTLSAGATAVTYTFITPFLVDVTGVAEATVPLVLMVAGIFGVAGMLTVGRFLDRYPMRTVAVILGVLVVVWTVMGVGGSHFWVAVPMLFVQNFAWACFVAAGVNRVMRHAPGSLDVGVAANASLYNLGTAVGSMLGAAVLAAVGAGWLPGASAVAVAIALAVLAFEWRKLTGSTALVTRRTARLGG